MKCPESLLLLILLSSPSIAQELTQAPVGSGNPGPLAVEMNARPPLIETPSGASDQGGFLTGDRAFPNFIGWVSNPVGIDPRALTQMWPVFASTWTGPIGPLPGGDVQLYGAGLSVAISERLEVGLNNGGYAVSHFDKNREGWLNLGGFVQYTLIRDVPNQFLVSGGLQWIAPSGEADVFQGHGPAKLAPYATVGKEFGDFHVLCVNGVKVPAGSGKNTSDTFFGSLHIDRRTMGWLYPLVEFNYGYAITHTHLDPKTLAPFGFIDAGGVNSSFSIITVAPGLNAVLIPNKLEMGAVYQTSIASERGFHFNEVLVKMIWRY